MYSGPIVDCDIHHDWRDTATIIKYMPAAWQAYVTGGGRAGEPPFAVHNGHWNPHGVYRQDEFPEEGGLPGSSLSRLSQRLLDGQRITRGILTYSTGLFLANVPHPYFAAEIASAANRWTAAEWLSLDDRIFSSIIVGNQLPHAAAKEVYSYADNPRFVQVLMANNGLTKPFGHPTMDPIHKAAADTGRPIALHAFSAGGIAPSPSAGGYPNYYIEYHAHGCQNLMTHLVSFLANGVFERYPDLRLLLVEGGTAWLPAIFWRLRDLYDEGAAAELPWLKSALDQTLRDHVLSTTQPFEVPSRPTTLTDMFGDLGGAQFLCFSTDYPHWDADDPMYVSRLLPAEWHRAVFYENACRLYGWSSDDLLIGAATSAGPNAELGATS